MHGFVITFVKPLKKRKYEELLENEKEELHKKSAKILQEIKNEPPAYIQVKFADNEIQKFPKNIFKELDWKFQKFFYANQTILKDKDVVIDLSSIKKEFALHMINYLLCDTYCMDISYSFEDSIEFLKALDHFNLV